METKLVSGTTSQAQVVMETPIDSGTTKQAPVNVIETPIDPSTTNQAQVAVVKKKEYGHQFAAPPGTYYSCCLLPNGLTALPNSTEQCILVLTPDFKLKSKFQFRGNEGVRHIAAIDSSRVAVTNPRTAELSVVDISKNECVKKLPTKQAVGGIVFFNGYILFCFPLSGIFRVSINGNPSYKVERVFADTRVTEDSNLVVNSNRICYTSQRQHAVTVLDSEYKILFQVQNRLFYDIYGITMDENFNIYVTSMDANNLVAISPDGSSCHQLLGGNNDLKCPTSVVYDRDKKQLIVVVKGGGTVLYSVKNS